MIAAHAACKLEEVEQLTKIELILLRDLYHQVRYISIRVCQDCSVHGALIYEINGLACQIVQSVQIYRLLVYGSRLTLRLLYIQNRLKQDSVAVLDELSHGMQVCGQINRCREDTLLVLSFALSVQLLPPLRYVVQARLIVCKHLDWSCPFARRMLRNAAYCSASFSSNASSSACFLPEAAPSISLSISAPLTAIGRSPTAVRTEKRPPTSSGTTKVS